MLLIRIEVYVYVWMLYIFETVTIDIFIICGGCNALEVVVDLRGI